MKYGTWRIDITLYEKVHLKRWKNSCNKWGKVLFKGGQWSALFCEKNKNKFLKYIMPVLPTVKEKHHIFIIVKYCRQFK